MAAGQGRGGGENGPREFLKNLGFDDSHFTKFRTGMPLDEGEREPLLRILFWLRRFDPLDVQSWARHSWPAREATDSLQGTMFRLNGRLNRIEQLNPPPELIERFEMPHYYRCEVFLEPDSRPAVLFTEKVPRVWREGGETGTRIGAEGMFLKYGDELPKKSPRSTPLSKGEGALGETPPMFVAGRLAWYPPTLLGDLDFDYGLFDNVEQNKPNLREEREAFYQMLAATGRAKPGEILAAAKEIPLRFDPERQLGKPFVLKGTARQVEMIRLGEGDRDIIERFHFDHYYQILLFTDESGDMPITFCVRQLPRGLPLGSGPGYVESVRIAGFFYKVWSYKISAEATEREEGEGLDARMATEPNFRRQLSPLLIGREPIWYPPMKPVEHTTTTLVLGGAFVVLFVVIWITVWRIGRGDRRFFRRLRDEGGEMDDHRPEEPPPTLEIKP